MKTDKERKRQQVQREFGENVKWIESLPELDLKNAEAVKERIFAYFDYCLKMSITISVTGLCAALGVDRRTFEYWQCGYYRPDLYRISRCAKTFICAYWELRAAESIGKTDVFSIYMLKNLHSGYNN